MKKSEQIKRCIKCNLPSNFPSIKFDDNGVCNYCINNQQTQYHYLGIEELKKEIDRILSNSSANRKYDCAVGLSGGRDGSFLLYLAKEVLGLNVLAVSVDHDFITPFARQNIKTLVERLGVGYTLYQKRYVELCK